MGDLVEKINTLTAQIYKEMLGKGPKRVRAAINNDILVIRVERDHNTISRHLNGIDKGRKVLELVGRNLFDFFKKDVKKSYEEVVKRKIKEIYYDAQKVEGEIVLTVIFEENIL